MDIDSTNNVNDRKSFSKFVGLLRQDFQQNPERWENDQLESFLGTRKK